MSIGNRLKKAIEIKGSSPYKLNKATKVSQSTIGRILKDESIPNRTTLLPLANSLGVNVEWLELGEGEMEYVKNVSNGLSVDFTEMNIMFVPLVNKYAYAGYLTGYGDNEYIDELPTIPFADDIEHKGEYLCFEVKGDSMDNDTSESYLEGDILLCRNVRQDFWRSKLHINKWDFVIVHREKGILIKRITKHNVETGDLILHSLNEFYEDIHVNLKDVAQIFNVVDVRRKRNRR